MSIENLADITIVLDRSGSMSIVLTDTIGGFNAFLDEQKKVPGAANLTLVQFDNVYEFVHQGVPLASVPRLTTETFIPRGGTALLDAVGRAINETGARLAAMSEQDRPGKVIFVILTDGAENASREFTRDKILAMVSHQRDAYGWTFVFLGANQDAIQAGASIGILRASSMTYAGENTAEAFASTSRNVASFRSGSAKSFSYSDADRAEAVKS